MQTSVAISNWNTEFLQWGECHISLRALYACSGPDFLGLAIDLLCTVVHDVIKRPRGAVQVPQGREDVDR